MQSSLLKRIGWRPGGGAAVARPAFLLGPVTRRRQSAALLLYSVLPLLALMLQAATEQAGLHAFASGLVFPGAGFLHWAGPGSATQAWAVALATVALAMFGAALLLWFGTGNILLPPVLWLGAALAAASPGMLGLDDGPAAGWPLGDRLMPWIGLAAAFLLLVRTRRGIVPDGPARAAPVQPVVRDRGGEIELDRLRLLLDRALQPVAAFDGFEWRDQFQTAAVRYQINFLSYALSIARHRHFPAATAYLAEAQRRLLAKQGQHRIWHYWALENAWGNLRFGADPVPRGNIMYGGFVAAQMAYAGLDAPLELVRPEGVWRRYDLDAITGLLAAQYRTSAFGLLPCEPGWIYPLCNLISATAIRAQDSRAGQARWAATEERFRGALMREFTGADGWLVPFRSALTGFAPTALGGAVMRAFPCLFLNALFPDLAERHWQRVRDDLARHDMKRAFWPVDVGNYGLSRAAGLAASAAAAVEMGDGDTAGRLLALLEEDCPTRRHAGVAHRDRASLWAHALELAARLGGANVLRAIVAEDPAVADAGPRLETAAYPEMLIAGAHRLGADALKLVLCPGTEPGPVPLGFAGLRPGQGYRVDGALPQVIGADAAGRAVLSLRLGGRTELRVVPMP